MSGADFPAGISYKDTTYAAQNKTNGRKFGRDKMRRNCRKDRAGIRRKARRNSEETASPELREKAGPDAEGKQARNSKKKQARTPRKSRHGRRELRESKPELLRDSDAPLKKNRIGHLKKKTQDQASDGLRRRETGKAQAGVPKDSGAADRQDGAGTGKPSEPQHFSSKSSASIHAGNFSLKAA